MTWVCSLVGHKLDGGAACVRCWPDGLPEGVEESLRELAECIAKVRALTSGKEAKEEA